VGGQVTGVRKNALVYIRLPSKWFRILNSGLSANIFINGKLCHAKASQNMEGSQRYHGVKFNREGGSGSSPKGLTDRLIYFYIGP
jgi:hypothetical protein